MTNLLLGRNTGASRRPVSPTPALPAKLGNPSIQAPPRLGTPGPARMRTRSSQVLDATAPVSQGCSSAYRGRGGPAAASGAGRSDRRRADRSRQGDSLRWSDTAPQLGGRASGSCRDGHDTGTGSRRGSPLEIPGEFASPTSGKPLPQVPRTELLGWWVTRPSSARSGPQGSSPAHGESPTREGGGVG
jgi:hypothetical protein